MAHSHAEVPSLQCSQCGASFTAEIGLISDEDKLREAPAAAVPPAVAEVLGTSVQEVNSEPTGTAGTELVTLEAAMAVAAVGADKRGGKRRLAPVVMLGLLGASLLAACAPAVVEPQAGVVTIQAAQSTEVQGAVIVPTEEPTRQPEVVEVMATEVPTETPEPTTAPAAPTPTISSPPTTIPTEAPPPTQEFIYEARENPYVVENGIVKMYVYDAATNQEILMEDPTFPYIELKQLADSERLAIRIGEITKDANGNFIARDLNYGRQDGRPGYLRAIKIVGGEWQASHLLNTSEYMPKNADPETMTALEFGMLPGFSIDDENARTAHRAFIQALITLNPEYFNWFTGYTGATYENVMKFAQANSYDLPVPPEDVPKLILPTSGRGGNHYVSHDRKRAEVGEVINIGNIGVLIFTPEMFGNNPIIEAFLQSSKTNHAISTGSDDRSQITGIIFAGGRIVFVHGLRYEYNGTNPDGNRYFDVSSISRVAPGEVPTVVEGFFRAYLRAFDPNSGGFRFEPLSPFAGPSSGIICDGGRGCQPVNGSNSFVIQR